MISLGQALFFGMGAYVTGILNHYWGLPPLLTIPAAAVFGGLICTALLLPVLRLRGIYFSMVTLILPLMLGAALATLFGDRFHPETAYTVSLVRKGIRLPTNEDIDDGAGVSFAHLTANIVMSPWAGPMGGPYLFAGFGGGRRPPLAAPRRVHLMKKAAAS